MTVDPLSVMSTISVGLKLIDQYGYLAKRFMDQPPQPPAETLEQAENTMELRHNGKVVQRRAGHLLSFLPEPAGYRVSSQSRTRARCKAE